MNTDNIPCIISHGDVSYRFINEHGNKIVITVQRIKDMAHIALEDSTHDSIAEWIITKKEFDSLTLLLKMYQITYWPEEK